MNNFLVEQNKQESKLRIASPTSSFVETRLKLAESITASLIDLSGLKLHAIDSATEDRIRKKFPKLLNFYANDNLLMQMSFSFLPITLNTLNLSNNRLSEIPLSFLNLKNLSQLILDNNRLRFISPSVFRDLPGLKRLDLRFNFLTTLPYEAIPRLTSFVFLGLSGNRLFKPELNDDFRWPVDNERLSTKLSEFIKECDWVIERLLWIGHFKGGGGENDEEKSPFYILPRDVIKLIRVLIV